MATVFLSRRATFCASHRLHSNKLSAAENKKLFGKCNNPNGHGHNYVLEVIVSGKVDSTGVVIDLTKLKEIIEESVVSRVDHKHLNLDVPEFKGVNPTAENMAVIFWEWLEESLPKNLLYEVRLQETENNTAIYRG
jgi:6-pyruvoyltetrahydropterin/6-carboxytetrahydropterin synthase